jgi:hypothetical protein
VWMETHVFLGPLAFFTVVILFCLLCIPESVVTVGGGYMFARAHGVFVGIVSGLRVGGSGLVVRWSMQCSSLGVSAIEKAGFGLAGSRPSPGRSEVHAVLVPMSFSQQ